MSFNFCLACLIVLKRVEVSLECDLLRRMGKLSVPKPLAVSRAPWLAFEAKITSKQESLDADAISTNVLAGRMSRPDEITERLV